MSWLEDHTNEFILPNLIEMMERDEQDVKYLRWSFDEAELLRPTTPGGYFTPAELTVIKNAWRSIKKRAKGRQVLLPGRDVFIFEILARRENYPTIFMPECSRMTVVEMANKAWDMRHCFLFDTGFAGSIPRALRSKKFGLLSYSSYDRNNTTQVFPRLTWSRSLALKIEGTPKYWESGRMGMHGEIVQPLSRPSEFIKAAQLTREIYTNSAPKFVKRHKPLVPEGAYMFNYNYGEGGW